MSDWYPDEIKRNQKAIRESKEARKAAGLAPLTLTDRKCLKCEKNFRSLGPFNRICNYCKQLTNKNFVRGYL